MMKRRGVARCSLVHVIAVALVACGGSATSGEISTSGGTATGGALGTAGSVMDCPLYATDSNGNLVLAASEANNYRFSSQLSVRTTMVKPNSELTFDWGGVTRDISGHPMDPAQDVGMVMVLLWNLTDSRLESKLNSDEVYSADLSAGASIFTRGAMTTGTFSDMEIVMGGPIRMQDLMSYFDDQQFAPEQHSYTVMVSSGTVPGKGVRSIQAFKLDPASANTTVVSDSNSTQLTYAADLHTQPHLPLPAGNAQLVVDWTMMNGQLNALGRSFDATVISQVRIASFTQTPSELESQFLDLPRIATHVWTGEVESGTSISLTSLKDADGQPFAGIDTSQTWLLALDCGRCMIPTPWHIMILEACSDQ